MKRTEQRKFLRFPVNLKIEVKKENKNFPGFLKDFSREGICCFFEEFDFNKGDILELKVQRPNKDIFIPAIGKIRWKKRVDNGWEVGMEFKDIPPPIKGEILEFAYFRWLNSNFPT